MDNQDHQDRVRPLSHWTGLADRSVEALRRAARAGRLKAWLDGSGRLVTDSESIREWRAAAVARRAAATGLPPVSDRAG